MDTNLFNDSDEVHPSPIIKRSDLVKKLPVSEIIRNRLVDARVSFFASDNIADYITPEEMLDLKQEIRENYARLLRSLIIDTDNDHNTKDTASRVTRMFVDEVFKGRYTLPPKITDFPNISNLDQIYTVGPIEVRSACSHHFVPILGKVWIGIHPSDRVMGLSKFHRITEWITSRPSIQEETTVMLADEIEKIINPQGLGVVYEAHHMCCSWRGVKDSETLMTSSIMRGTLREYGNMKDEFFRLIGK